MSSVNPTAAARTNGRSGRHLLADGRALHRRHAHVKRSQAWREAAVSTRASGPSSRAGESGRVWPTGRRTTTCSGDVRRQHRIEARPDRVVHRAEPEPPRHHADDRVRRVVDPDGLAHDVGTRVEPVAPEPVAEHGFPRHGLSGAARGETARPSSGATPSSAKRLSETGRTGVGSTRSAMRTSVTVDARRPRPRWCRAPAPTARTNRPARSCRPAEWVDPAG